MAAAVSSPVMRFSSISFWVYFLCLRLSSYQFYALVFTVRTSFLHPQSLLQYMQYKPSGIISTGEFRQYTPFLPICTQRIRTEKVSVLCSLRTHTSSAPQTSPVSSSEQTISAEFRRVPYQLIDALPRKCLKTESENSFPLQINSLVLVHIQTILHTGEGLARLCMQKGSCACSLCHSTHAFSPSTCRPLPSATLASFVSAEETAEQKHLSQATLTTAISSVFQSTFTSISPRQAAIKKTKENRSFDNDRSSDYTCSSVSSTSGGISSSSSSDRKHGDSNSTQGIDRDALDSPYSKFSRLIDKNSSSSGGIHCTTPARSNSNTNSSKGRVEEQESSPPSSFPSSSSSSSFSSLPCGLQASEGKVCFHSWPIFIPFAIEKEFVWVKLERHFSRYSIGTIAAFAGTPSPHRITPPCPYYGRCSGCQYQHMPLWMQGELKRKQIQRLLQQSFGGKEEVAVKTVLPAALKGPHVASWKREERQEPAAAHAATAAAAAPAGAEEVSTAAAVHAATAAAEEETIHEHAARGEASEAPGCTLLAAAREAMCDAADWPSPRQTAKRRDAISQQQQRTAAATAPRCHPAEGAAAREAAAEDARAAADDARAAAEVLAAGSLQQAVTAAAKQGRRLIAAAAIHGAAAKKKEDAEPQLARQQREIKEQREEEEKEEDEVEHRHLLEAEGYHYRTKLTPHYTFYWPGEVPCIGFCSREHPSVVILDIQRCCIATAAVNKGLQRMRERLRNQFLLQAEKHAISLTKQKRGGTLLLRDAGDGDVATHASTRCTTIVSAGKKRLLFSHRAADFFQINPRVLQLLVNHVRKQLLAPPSVSSSHSNGTALAERASTHPTAALSLLPPVAASSLPAAASACSASSSSLPAVHSTCSAAAAASTTAAAAPATAAAAASGAAATASAAAASPLPAAVAASAAAAVSAAASRQGRVLVDAYCGVGVFAIACHDLVSEVLGFDISASSVSLAQRNARTNGISNCSFAACDAAMFFSEVLKEKDANSFRGAFACGSEEKKALYVILDPPRTGCSSVCLRHLLEPCRIVYVSCHPVTQARDIKQLVEADYAVTDVQPFEMFPQTRHVECVVTLDDKLHLPAATCTALSS